MYPCFPVVLLNSTLHKILSKPLAAYPLPNVKIYGLEEILKYMQMTNLFLLKLRYVFDRVENIVRKGENADYCH